MDIRDYKESDYQMICSWREGHKKPHIKKDFLPRCGVIASEGIDIAAGWLIMTDANIGILEHGLSNPEAKNSDIYRAVRLIITELTKRAKDAGIKQVWGIVSNRGIGSAYDELGFAKQNNKFDIFTGNLWE